MQRLNELYAATGQVGFRVTQRVDGRLVQNEGLKCPTRCSPPCGKPASWQERWSSEVRIDARLGG